MAGLFKNLRLEIFVSPYVITYPVSRDIPNEDKTVGLFKNLIQVHVISEAVARDIPNEEKTVELFKNLRLETFEIPGVES